MPIIILVIGITVSCERDDLCPESTSTTPSLIIRTFDVNEQENKKNVFGLTIKGEGNNNFLEGYKTATRDSIVLPLKTIGSSTVYNFYSNSTIDDNGTPTDESDDVISGNLDVITITYTTETVFVSRACGYKTIFNDVVISVEDDSDNWIQLIQPVNNPQSVEDEAAAHFKLFH
ncbi:DUF6452 family protein [Sabulilitoribacter arenilitoris]|uniref:DUF6452 family protein n=1 Tax=Wocania arenilitoris TaxID=2044858 RepID=A0AAE3JMJ5_9FLAO|nr:DUF6452 family protein [Wocania arenilitoris]MCF7569392.1 DUF6452 family protein [Wocania arenilitoris]